jgi:hypothetical protein
LDKDENDSFATADKTARVLLFFLRGSAPLVGNQPQADER